MSGRSKSQTKDADGTLEQLSASRSAAHDHAPGLVAVFAGGRPVVQALPLRDARLEIGRLDGDLVFEDPFTSRRHAEIALVEDRWVVTDLGSRNGTFVNGQRLGGAPAEIARGRRVVVRIGNTLYMASEDVKPFSDLGVRELDGAVVGPRLAEALARVRDAGAAGGSVLILGESGSGKELAAQAFHAAGPRPKRPFIAVNCAAIPESVAERLLFGSLRGAYSGATDAVGYVQAADGGTLFLDEVGELPAALQAKLLRVLETGELMPLGASRTHQVSTRFCFATMRNLRLLVAEQRFRPDLFYRIARHTVTLPPLRERTEEIPWLVMRELAAVDPALAAHSSLIEACLLRSWAGNIRELQSCVRHAAGEARRGGKAEVRDAHLPPCALEDEPPSAEPAAQPGPSPQALTAEVLRSSLTAHGGNLTAAARALGLHRSRFYRLLERHGIYRDP